MVAQSRSIQILDPCPEEVPRARGCSAALPSIAGKVIGLLENRKYHADAFLHELQKVLQQDYGVKKLSTPPSLATAHPVPMRRSRRWWWSAMPLSTVLRIEVLHGVGSPRHGSDRIPRRAIRQRPHQRFYRGCARPCGGAGYA